MCCQRAFQWHIYPPNCHLLSFASAASLDHCPSEIIKKLVKEEKLTLKKRKTFRVYQLIDSCAWVTKTKNAQDGQTQNISRIILNIDYISPSADMVRLYVNVQFQVKPLNTGTGSSQTKKIF